MNRSVNFRARTYEARDCESDRLQHHAAGPALAESPPSVGRSRDRACRRASTGRPARRTRPSSGSRSSTTTDAYMLDRSGTGRQSGAEDPGTGSPDRRQRGPGAVRGVPSLPQPRGRRGAEQGQQPLARGGRLTRRRVPPREVLLQSARKFRIGQPTWQLDIYRQLRNARDAAGQRYAAAIERRNYFVTRLVAEVAENYYRLMALDKRLENLDQIIALQEQSLKMPRPGRKPPATPSWPSCVSRPRSAGTRAKS